MLLLHVYMLYIGDLNIYIYEHNEHHIKKTRVFVNTKLNNGH